MTTLGELIELAPPKAGGEQREERQKRHERRLKEDPEYRRLVAAMLARTGRDASDSRGEAPAAPANRWLVAALVVAAVMLVAGVAFALTTVTPADIQRALPLL